MATNEHDVRVGDNAIAAARLLEVAARNADELLEEARAEAASIVAAAHADAKQVQAELEQERRQQSDELDRDRTTALAELAGLAERRAALEAEVAQLEQLEQENRDRIRTYLTDQLAQITSTPDPDAGSTSTG